MKINIFYSWQSDLPNKSNRNFIQDCLEKAIKKIQKDLSLELCIDRDTASISGSPDIVKTIFDKIKESKIFVADVSIINYSFINKFFDYRLMPNPNVMLELGYASRRLGWNQIICLQNTKFASPEDLPFDIRHRRIISYNSEKNDKESLINHLKGRIKEIIESPDFGKTDTELDAEVKHDLDLFTKISSKIPEDSVISMLDWIGSNHIYDFKNTRDLRSLVEFLELESNQFIDEKIKKESLNLREKINSFSYFLAMNFFPSRNNPGIGVINYYEDRDWNPSPEFIKLSSELSIHIAELKKAYEDFRKVIKMKLKV